MSLRDNTDMPSVAVAMSTYNGELYMEQQIDSILSQEGVNVVLYIRDDGSSDDSCKILEKYQLENSNVHVCFGKNIGVGNSFMQCLYSIKKEYDYYAFSDQDDIWHSNKLIEAILYLRENGKELYFSNQTCVNKKNEIICERYVTPPKYQAIDVLNNNMMAGCTFVFSNSFFHLLVAHKPNEKLLKKRIHDVWVAEIGALKGLSIYDSRSFINYRQHESNVVGAFVKDGFFSKIKRKVKKIRRPEIRNGRSALAREVYMCFPEFRENEIIKYAANANSIMGKWNLIRHYSLFSPYDSKLRFVTYVILGLF